MSRAARAGLLGLVGAALLASGGPRLGGGPGVGVAVAAPGWRAEFDDICARTQDAMALSSEALKALVARSDALLPELEKLEPTERKVFVRRLQACRALYQFVLDTRERG